ncbi:MAG TPA: aldehyde dehydrogenase family protein [Chloroflexota bacterium]|nr:aldehyde dehydrogenase family protein [Chloroflexota bacterium]
MAEVYHNYIGGKWVPSQNGDTFESCNPACTSEVIGVFQRSNKQDVISAIDAAHAALPGWMSTPAPIRASYVRRVGQLLERDKEALAQLETREMGKVVEEGRGDVQEGIDMADYISGEGRRMFGETVPSELRDKFAMMVRQPLGVVGLITPWNFPVAIPTWKIFPALVTGNTIVFKPAEDTPAAATALVKLFEEAGLPAGVLNLVTGYGPEAGAPIVEDARIRMISFTGSSAVGREIAAKAGRDLKKTMLELGGKNPMIVMPDADLDLALEGALWGAFGTTGQRCTATSRIIVHRDIADEFTTRLIQQAKSLKVGYGLEPGVQVGPLINAQQLQTVDEYVQIGKQEGASLLLGGKRLTGGSYDNGYFYAPTIFGDVNYRMRIAQEEIFGPVVAVMPVSSYDEAIQVANSTEYGLSSSIYTRDVNLAFRAMRDMEAGISYVNAPTIGAEIQLPFGGVKATGNGHREAGTSAIKEFTEPKAIYVDYSGRLQRAQIDVEHHAS